MPQADPTDGILEVLTVEKVTRLQVPGLIGKYKAGRYQEIPQLIRHYRTDRLRIAAEGPTAVNLDGELLKADTIHISLAEEKLRFFYPKGLTWK